MSQFRDPTGRHPTTVHKRKLEELNHDVRVSVEEFGVGRKYRLSCRYCLYEGSLYEDAGHISDLYGWYGPEGGKQCQSLQHDMLVRFLWNRR